jgi:luciferase family oxidoreductase group 1
MVKISVLDLAQVREGGTPAEALRNTLELARHVDGLGCYERYWLAEHHNLAGVASAATAVLIGQVAAVTQRIRVGSGGIMLPNHAPLMIAEQFGTLDALYPGRIDLGLGRAPGTDGYTLRALRREYSSADTFPQDVEELIALLEPVQPGQRIVAVPGAGSRVPVWILGSSLFGSQLAAALGLPYAFASHFAPAALHQALHVYRARYTPTERNPRPHAMAGVNVICAPTDEEALLLASSLRQAVLNLVRGRPALLPPPRAGFDATLSAEERERVDGFLACSFIGSPETVRRGLTEFVATTAADELIVASAMFDPAARQRSYSLLAQLWPDVAGASRLGPAATL